MVFGGDVVAKMRVLVSIACKKEIKTVVPLAQHDTIVEINKLTLFALEKRFIFVLPGARHHCMHTLIVLTF